MFKVIQNKIPKDRDFPDRYYPLMIYKRIMDGTLYDCFDHHYMEEYMGSELHPQYVPESERAPCLNQGMNLLRSVVEQSVSFLFGEDRFPTITCEDDATKKFIEDVVRDTKLVQVFQDAATRGSIGSVAIHCRVSKDRFFPKVHDTLYLTPFYDDDEPDTLVRIVEKKKVLGADLANVSPPYKIKTENLNSWFWFQREWTKTGEIWYHPWLVSDAKPDYQPVEDDLRSKYHNLGMVPWVWIKNLVGSDNDIDGKCTFEPGVEGAIQIDYALSRVDKVNKYNCDPLVVLKTRNPNSVADFVRGQGNMLSLGVEADASILETTGKAAEATLEVIKEMKDEVLASIHGCRADPSKLATSNSSVAQRMLYLPMVGLASHLRQSYGFGGIMPLIKMMMQIASEMPIKVLKKYVKKIDPDQDINLIFSDFFPPTPFDVSLQAQSLQVAVMGGFMSKQTAAENMRKYVEIDDIDTEMSLIEADQDDEQEREIDTQSEIAKAKPAPAVRPVSKTKSVSRS